jgi:hypothetical protein
MGSFRPASLLCLDFMSSSGSVAGLCTTVGCRTGPDGLPDRIRRLVQPVMVWWCVGRVGALVCMNAPVVCMNTRVLVFYFNCGGGAMAHFLNAFDFEEWQILVYVLPGTPLASLGSGFAWGPLSRPRSFASTRRSLLGSTGDVGSSQDLGPPELPDRMGTRATRWHVIMGSCLVVWSCSCGRNL